MNPLKPHGPHLVGATDVVCEGIPLEGRLPKVKSVWCEIHPLVKFGEKCTVWQFATICENTVIGDEVVVGSNVWIGKHVHIGSWTRIQHGAFIPNGCQIGEAVFIGPNVTLTDDKHPKAGFLYKSNPPILENDCSIGAGAIILPGVRIARGTMVGAGAVVTQDTLPMSLVLGIPARVQTHESAKESYEQV